MAAAVFGYQQWQLYQQTREIEELDVQILTSDLPIDAYVDRGFQTWLTKYQPASEPPCRSSRFRSRSPSLHSTRTPRSSGRLRGRSCLRRSARYWRRSPPDWDHLDAQRKVKWRGIAQRYPEMSPDEQQKIQQQMKSWSELTPQQRQAAREQYKSMRQLPPEKKDEVRQRWQEYQSLPPDQKRELAAKAQAGTPRTMAPAMTPPQQATPPAGAQQSDPTKRTR